MGTIDNSSLNWPKLYWIITRQQLKKYIPKYEQVWEAIRYQSRLETLLPETLKIISCWRILSWWLQFLILTLNSYQKYETLTIARHFKKTNIVLVYLLALEKRILKWIVASINECGYANYSINGVVTCWHEQISVAFLYVFLEPSEWENCAAHINSSGQLVKAKKLDLKR